MKLTLINKTLAAMAISSLFSMAAQAECDLVEVQVVTEWEYTKEYRQHCEHSCSASWVVAGDLYSEAGTGSYKTPWGDSSQCESTMWIDTLIINSSNSNATPLLR